MGETRRRRGGVAGRLFVGLVVAALAMSGCSRPPAADGGPPREGASLAAPTGGSSAPASGSGGTAGSGALLPRGPVDGGWRVSRVVDGDTVHVTRAGTRLKVRVLGIDTPETVDPGAPVGCFGPQATAFARAALLDRAVTLEYDDSQGRTDRYGRTLAYVWLDADGSGSPASMYEIDALEAGVAREYLYDEPYAWREAFVAAQEDARRAGRGLWSACPVP